MGNSRNLADLLNNSGDLTVDNIHIDGNTISSTDTNGDITLDPNGSGDVVVAQVFIVT